MFRIFLGIILLLTSTCAPAFSRKVLRHIYVCSYLPVGNIACMISCGDMSYNLTFIGHGICAPVLLLYCMAFPTVPPCLYIRIWLLLLFLFVFYDFCLLFVKQCFYFVCLLGLAALWNGFCQTMGTYEKAWPLRR